MKLAILGGTGKEGQGLALRWARAGRDILLGSRDASKGDRIARELNAELGHARVLGMSNLDAAREGEIVVSALPHDGHLEILRDIRRELHGKLLVTATIAWPPGSTERASAGEEAQETLGDGSRVVAAFQTISARTLRDMEPGDREDVLICSDDDGALEAARTLVEETGFRGVIAGPLVRARTVEAITGLLLNINRRYGVKSSGIRITGIEGSES